LSTGSDINRQANLYDKQPARSAIVLVGGEARRAGGKEKYFFSFEGRTFIERLIGTLEKVVDEIILVARDPDQCDRFTSFPNVKCVCDLEPGQGPVGGLHSGIRTVTGDLVFVSACDMPCIKPEVVDFLFKSVREYDAVVPCWDEAMYEPLHAVYRSVPLKEFLDNSRVFSLRNIIHRLNVRYIPVEQLRVFDPELTGFTNINHLEELEKLTNGLQKKG
jgi:molybdopterin-guanine dinucleotide biosynthesis protein A